MLVKIDTESEELFDCTLVACGSRTVIIDNEDADRIVGYTWYVRRTRFNCYAYRIKIIHGKKFMVWMHRQIMHCPDGMVVHHKNRNGLDNRKENLELMTEKQHAQLHRFR